MVRLSLGLWTTVLAVALACCCAAAAGAAQFQDIAPALGIPGAVGAAWGDYDGDGYADLFLTGNENLAHGAHLLHNNGDLSFTDVSAAAGIPTTLMEQINCAWADYDSDGLLDLYHNDGGTFTDVAAQAGVATIFASGNANRTAAWCDYDGDGQLDLFACAIEGRLLHSNGDGTFTDATSSAGLTGDAQPTGAHSCAWGDYDNDGRPDLIVTRPEPRKPLLYHNNGDGTFTDVGGFLSVVSDGAGMAWGDYDNDGWLDLYITTAVDEARDWLFHNNGDGTFTDVAASAGMGADASTSDTVACADYDNDGYLDIYVGNTETGGESMLYHNNGDGTFTNVAHNEGMAGTYHDEAAAWADVDHDGRIDLCQAGQLISRLFHNVGPAGNWLRVQALTSGSGDATGADPVRDAIGARVEVNLDNDDSFAAGRTLTRLIDGGSGFLGQNEQIAHFGLGASALLAVRVRFPDGSVVVHRSVAANQQLIIRDVPADREEIFDDVPLDYWAYPAIAAALDAGIVQGYWDNTYRPAGQVDRASMAVYVARALAGGDAQVPTGPEAASFTDVAADHWAYKYIEYAASPEANVVQGYPGGNYKPDDLVNRGQMAVYIARAMVTPSGDAGVPGPPAGDPTFSDVTATGEWSWCYKHVEYLAAEGIVQGYPDGTYHPATIVTRDQMAVYIQRAFDLPL
jgi:hypothetical protein